MNHDTVSITLFVFVCKIFEAQLSTYIVTITDNNIYILIVMQKRILTSDDWNLEHFWVFKIT